MTNELTGRELDEAVAKALGWLPVTEESPYHANGFAGCWIPPPVYRNAEDRKNNIELTIGKLPRPLPAYSIDYAALPEMLAWLRTRFIVDHEGEIELRWDEDGRYWVASMSDCSLECGQPWNASAANLPEAVARLVVKVAEVKP